MRVPLTLEDVRLSATWTGAESVSRTEIGAILDLNRPPSRDLASFSRRGAKYSPAEAKGRGRRVAWVGEQRCVLHRRARCGAAVSIPAAEISR